MSRELRTWIATPAERRAAWIIASVAIVMVIGAFAWPTFHRNYPDLFVFSTQESGQEPASMPNTDPAPESEMIEKIIAKAQMEPVKPVKIQPEVTEPAIQPVTEKPVAVKVAPPQTAPAQQVTPAPKPVPSEKTAILPAGYYVQVGAFSEKPRAEALQKQLASKWSTHLKAKSSRIIAVWAGPYPSAKEAERIKADIASRAKIKGFIVKN